jgi:hypothetical protein
MIFLGDPTWFLALSEKSSRSMDAFGINTPDAAAVISPIRSSIIGYPNWKGISAETMST